MQRSYRSATILAEILENTPGGLLRIDLTRITIAKASSLSFSKSIPLCCGSLHSQGLEDNRIIIVTDHANQNGKLSNGMSAKISVGV